MITERVVDPPEGFQILNVAEIAAVTLSDKNEAIIFVIAETGLKVQVIVSLPALEVAIQLIRQNHVPHLSAASAAPGNLQ